MSSEEQLTINVLVYTRQLANGRVVTSTIAERALATAGSATTASSELSAHLSKMLETAPAEQVARYVLTHGAAREGDHPTRLVQTSVPLVRDDLPRRFNVDVPISLSSLVIPVASEERREETDLDRWVFLLPFGYTFFLQRGQDLDEAVAREAKRLVVAHQLTHDEWLELLPQPKESLGTITIGVHRTQAAKHAETKARARATEAKKRSALDVLKAVGRRITSIPPIHARTSEQRAMRALLRSDKRQSVLLVGPARSGKSSIFRAAIEDDMLVFSTSGADIVAGMGGFGQWQERLRRVLEAAHELDAILFFGDLGDLLADHAGWVDVPAAMKPWLEENRVRIVAEISHDLDRAEARAPGFLSCFVRLRVNPMSANETRELLEARVKSDASSDRPKVESIETIVDLAERYLPYQALPGKAVQLYDDVRASAALRAGSDASNVVLGPREVLADFAIRTGIPEVLLRDDLRLGASDVIERLSKRLIGQNEAKQSLARVICSVKANLQPRGKPLATLFFVGPTGVGKTELARALAAELFGDPERLVRVDMSELSSAHSATRLFGAEGSLTRAVRDQPFSVVLLDEIEKAHPDVFDVLLQITGEGRLTDERGRLTYFDNAILVLTSNLGALHRRPRVGFEGAPFDARRHYERVISETFRPELVNRLDRIVVFDPLAKNEVELVAETTLARIADRRGASERSLAFSRAAIAKIAEDGASDAYGARAIRRYVEKTIVTPMAEMLSLEENRGPGAIRITLARESEPQGRHLLPGSGFRVSFQALPAKMRTDGSSAVSTLRRDMQSTMTWSTIRRLREQVDFVRVELSYGPKSQERQYSRDVSLLMQEHHRLSRPLEAIDALYDEVITLEDADVAARIAGLARQKPALPTDRFHRAACEAVFSLDTCRDGIVLLLQELDGGRVLNAVLPAFVHEAAAREWKVIFHTDRGETGMTERATGRWTEPRALGDLIAPSRDPLTVLAIVTGKHAGSLLSREVGLHVFHGLRNEPCAYFVTPVAKTAVLSKTEWQLPELAPMTASTVKERRKQRPVRKWMVRDDKVEILLKVTLDCPMSKAFERFEEIAYHHEREIEMDPECGPGVFALFSARLDPVTRALRAGNKIQAIKLYREATGVSLKDAKDAVDAMELV